MVLKLIYIYAYDPENAQNIDPDVRPKPTSTIVYDLVIYTVLIGTFSLSD